MRTIDAHGGPVEPRLRPLVVALTALALTVVTLAVDLPSSSGDTHVATASFGDRSSPTAARKAVSVGKGREVPAKSTRGTAKAADVRTVLAVRFNARKGERRLVAAAVRAYQPSTTPDPLLMASTALVCTPPGGVTQTSSATQNIFRGKIATLSTAFVYAAKESGEVRCVVRAFGSRPRPTPPRGDHRGTNRWFAWQGSKLYLGDPQPSWSETSGAWRRSALVRRGGATRAMIPFAKAPSGTHRAIIVSDHKITTCSTTRGSRDDTTEGEQLCTGHEKPTGSRVRLIVRLLPSGGCGSRVVLDKTYRIGAATHHRTIRGAVVIKPPPSRCGRKVQVSTRLVNVGGAPVVVHTTSGRTTIASA